MSDSSITQPCDTCGQYGVRHGKVEDCGGIYELHCLPICVSGISRFQSLAGHVLLCVLDEKAAGTISATAKKPGEEYVLVPPDGRSHGPEVPQTVRVHHSPYRGEIEQLQTHRHHDPRHDQTRPRCPRLLRFSVSRDTKPAPQDILHYPCGNICGHIVAVVPPP